MYIDLLKYSSFENLFLKSLSTTKLIICLYSYESIFLSFELFHYIQVYISEILRNTSFTYIYEDNFYIFDEEGPVIAFAVTDSYDTILPVALTMQKDDLCFDIIKCFLIMIKDMREMMPYVISDVVGKTEQVLNKIKKANIYSKNDKKYDLKKLLKEMKKL